MKKFLKSNTVTAKYVRGDDKRASRRIKRIPAGWLKLNGATGHNLLSVDLELPLSTLTVISGVSGSGKSTLIVDTLHKAVAKKLRLSTDKPLTHKSIEGWKALRAIKLIDQAPIGRTPRSNPVTYLKLFDSIRKLFADQHESRMAGHGPGFFSFNVPGGRCESCKGEGLIKLEMYFFEDLYVKCEDCHGRRYGPEALGIKYMDKSIDEVLDLRVDEAEVFFSASQKIKQKLILMQEVGLGYLKLGQPATTLSGGEAQRLKLCAELGSGKAKNVLYILDEPTVGLHANDVDALLGVLGRLVDSGNTVVVIEHNLDVIAEADWIVDLGPEGGGGGGRIVYAGPPEDIEGAEESYTGRYLLADDE